MKKMMLGLVAVFAMSSFVPAFAGETAPAGDAKTEKAPKAPKKAKTGKKAEGETKDAPAK